MSRQEEGEGEREEVEEVEGHKKTFKRHFSTYNVAQRKKS